MVTLPERLTPPNVAVIVTAVLAATAPAVMVKFAELDPAGTVTEEGTAAAAGFELVRLTTIPPPPAAAPRVTEEAAEVAPLFRLVGLTVIPVNATG
jgi:hypothetical protein